MIALPRRSFLRGGIAVALVPVALGAAAAPACAAVEMGALTRAALEDACGSRVRLVATDRTTAATLVEVLDLPSAAARHPDAFAARIELDDEIGTGLVDIELPQLRVTGAGLLAGGVPGALTATLLVDRRSVAEHLRRTASGPRSSTPTR